MCQGATGVAKPAYGKYSPSTLAPPGSPPHAPRTQILHFHLVNPIMIGNKKTKDVQFYFEVGRGNQGWREYKT
jgi:hypothetical protein